MASPILHHRRCAHCGETFTGLGNTLGARQHCSLACRFWSKVAKTADNDGCWNWIAGRHKGYGTFGIDGGKTQAPRVAYLLANGPFDLELFVLHRCDNPACCNPRHLFLGTHDDNMRDMSEKGRSDKSPEWRREISAKLMGHGLSAEGRAKISAKQMGRKAKPETVAKRVQKVTGQKRTAEARARMSAARRAVLARKQASAGD